MTKRQLARNLHELWERAQAMHLDAQALVDHLPARDLYSRLALELVLHDLLAFAARAAALADLAEEVMPRRRKR